MPESLQVFVRTRELEQVLFFFTISLLIFQQRYKGFEQEVVDNIKKQDFNDVFKAAGLFDKVMKQKIQKEIPELRKIWHRRIGSSMKEMIISSYIADHNLLNDLLKSPQDIALSFEVLMYILEQFEAWRNSAKEKVETPFIFITSSAENQLAQQKMKVLKAMLQDLQPVLAPTI